MNQKKPTAAINRFFRLLLAATLLAGAPPLAFYSYARLSGSLPTEGAWLASGGKGGPWLDEWQALPVMLCFFVMVSLPIVTLVFTFLLGFTARENPLLQIAKGLALTSLQSLWAFCLLKTIFWTID